MAIVPSKVLGGIGVDNLLDELSPLPLEEAQMEYRNFAKKQLITSG